MKRRSAQAENRAALEAYNEHVERHGRLQRGRALLLMAQFDVYRNPNSTTRAAFPTCSMCRRSCWTRSQPASWCRSPSRKSWRKPIERLNPQFEVEGRKVVMLTPELAGVPRKALGEVVGDLARERDKIIAALDLAFTGI